MAAALTRGERRRRRGAGRGPAIAACWRVTAPELGFRHPLLRAAALAAAIAGADSDRPIARWQACWPPTRTSLAGTWHRAEAAVGPDPQLAADLVRAADQQPEPPGVRRRVGRDGAGRAAQRRSRPDRGLAGDRGGRRVRGRGRRADRSLVARVLDGPGRRSGAWGGRCSRSGCSSSTPARCPRPSSCSRPRPSGSTVWTARGPLAELALARFRLNDIAGVDDCAVGSGRSPTTTIPSSGCSRTSPGVSPPSVGGDRATGGVLLAETHRADRRSAAARRSAIAALPGAGRGLPRRPARGHGAGLLPAGPGQGPGRARRPGAGAGPGRHRAGVARRPRRRVRRRRRGVRARRPARLRRDAAVAVEMLAWQSAARGLHDDARAALRRARSLTDRAGTTAFAAHQAITAAFCALCRADPACGRRRCSRPGSPSTAASDRWASRRRRSRPRRGLPRARSTGGRDRRGRAVRRRHTDGGATAAAGAGRHAVGG